MTARELKEKFISFFEKRGHKRLPNVSLIPENDPTALFINSGMHPLVPYLLGEPHPQGKRLVSLQRCLRAQDIEEVGDVTHLTFFEMLGNWSLGDYWKKEAISWSWEFLTTELNLDHKRLSVTCFAGDKDASRDEETAKIWQSLGVPKERIYFLGKKDNWWAVGETGPCGPDTEMFYDTGKKKCGPKCRPGDDCGKFFEVWNDVFIQFNKLNSGKLEKLKQRNIDTGMGVERMMTVLQGKDDVYQTEAFASLINQIEEISKKKYQRENVRPMRIIADHIKAATFAIADGVIPTNVEAGYVVRRLIKDAITEGMKLDIETEFTVKIATTVIKNYQREYKYLKDKKGEIKKQCGTEEEKFIKADRIYKRKPEKSKLEMETGKRLKKGDKPEEVFKAEVLPKIKGLIQNYDSFSPYVSTASGVAGTVVFTQKSTFGRPIEGTTDVLKRYIHPFNEGEFNRAFRELQRRHQKVSRKSAKKKFAGGLADHSEEVKKLHTATHLLHRALRDVLGGHVQQVGSNITPERLRFDFTHPEKLTEAEIKQVEDIINKQIKADLPVKMEMTSLEEAKKKGALAFFDQKYGEKVKVYSIGPSTISGRPYSVEVCGGPHVGFTGQIGRVRITKEGSVGAGRRRIYLQPA